MAALLLVLAAGLATFPWKAYVETLVKDSLKAKGFTRVELSLAEAGLSRVVFKDIALESPDVRVSIAQATLSGKPKLPYPGRWDVEGINVEKPELPASSFSAKGAFIAGFGGIKAEGKVRDATGATQLAFRFDRAFVVTEFSMPWSGGTVSAKDVEIPLQGNAAVDIDLKIEGVSAEALLGPLTGGRATATGKISGTLPLSIAPDKTVSFRDGLLQAEGPGTIAVSPDVVPGDNPQVALVREILKDFRYTSLSLRLATAKESKLQLALRLEGSNPGVEKGRAVKLNVNLGGDVIGFVQQNLLWLTDPQKIMEQGRHAKP